MSIRNLNTSLGMIAPFRQVLETKNPTDATLVLSKLERILSKLVEFGRDLKEDEKLELVFDGRKEQLTFYKVKCA